MTIRENVNGGLQERIVRQTYEDPFVWPPQDIGDHGMLTGMQVHPRVQGAIRPCDRRQAGEDDSRGCLERSGDLPDGHDSRQVSV